MKVIEKIKNKQNDFFNDAITIAFLGDSVTHGCYECYIDDKGDVQTLFDSKSSYVTRFKELMSILYPSVQINIINAGISGDDATNGCKRFDKDIAPFNPDLVVVAFGLNDSCGGEKKLKQFKNSISLIFEKIKKINAECIYIANNMMNTKVSPFLREKTMIDMANFYSGIQNNGILKKYFDEAKIIANQYNIPIVDIYSAWDKMFKNGVDTTELLANKLNHPIRTLHYYTAIKLIEQLFDI